MPLVLLAAGLLTSAGCSDACLLNGECPGDTLCLDGICRTPCALDTACPIDEFCLGGACRGLMPGERPPCRDDAGCFEADMAAEPDAMLEADVGPDAALDAGVDGGSDGSVDGLLPDGGPLDGGLLDGGPLDAAPLDGSPLDGSLDGALLDGGQLDGGQLDGGRLDGGLDAGDAGLGDGATADGGLGVDLTGLYAVTTTVVVATGGDLAAGDELRHIHRLEWSGGSRYRLEVYATDGAFEHQGEIDLASPDGPGRYQYEYPLAVDAPEGCEGAELRFQRGRFERFAPGYRLLAGEERTVGFEGEQCGADGYLVRVDMVWTPLPPP